MIRTDSFRIDDRERRLALFSFVWLAGLVCGGILANQASDTYLTMMRRAAQTPATITGLLAAMFLPFLAVFFCVYISRPKFLYPICFLKACFFTLAGFGIYKAFGSSGWLIGLLLQFTDTGALVLLCWFVSRHLDGSRENLWVDMGLAGACLFCLGCLDYCYVSPFLALQM